MGNYIWHGLMPWMCHKCGNVNAVCPFILVENRVFSQLNVGLFWAGNIRFSRAVLSRMPFKHVCLHESASALQNLSRKKSTPSIGWPLVETQKTNFAVKFSATAQSPSWKPSWKPSMGSQSMCIAVFSRCADATVAWVVAQDRYFHFWSFGTAQAW